MNVRLISRAGVVALAAATALSLSSCGGPGPGAAAVVNGQRISETDLESVVKDLSASGLGQVAPGRVLSVMVSGRVLTDSAERLKLPAITDAQAKAFAVNSPGQDGTSGLGVKVEPSAATVAMTRGYLYLLTLAQQGGDAAIAAAVSGADVQVDPRYGDWNGQLVPSSPNWIVTPKATPAPNAPVPTDAPTGPPQTIPADGQPQTAPATPAPSASTAG